MNIYNATEIAFKNGYEKGVKDFAERLSDKISDSLERSQNSPDGDNYFITDVYTDIDKLEKEMLKGS